MVKIIFKKDFKVYEREGLSCKKHQCKGIIIKNIISRSTFFVIFVKMTQLFYWPK